MIGTTLSHYRIVEKIGAGGMGEVYRAYDERLDRDVAIKVLPNEVANDEARLARFEREAKLLASLNHQNIATLHGLEEHDGQGFLVMELAEGTDLAHRIAFRPLPIDEALDYACQIAEGLEAAHEKGIIHRDLKPANMMLSPEGGIKILDFGLAKAFDPPGSDPSSPESIADSPTLTAAMTGTGVLLGTAAYMSPEQARGKRADKRADVWAFGCVLYEMLTGRKAFEADDSSGTMAAILRDEPDWDALPPATPAHIQRLLKRCLAKKPHDRLHDIADARIEIESIDNGSIGLVPGGKRTVWSPAIRASASVGLVALGIAAGAFGVRWFARPAVEEPLAVQIETFEELPWLGMDSQHVALSPDGRHLVYVVGAEVVGGDKHLVHRPSGRFKATAIPGSEDASYPFFSPDSRWVGFRANGGLKKVALDGGQPVDLCEDCGGSAAWSPDGREIIFAQGSLNRISASGGEFTAVSRPAEGKVHSRPQYLPDGRAVLLEVCDRESWNCDVGILDLDNGQLEILIQHGSNPVFAPSGHLVFARDDALYAVAFDSGTRSCSGEPSRVLQGVSYHKGRNSQYSLSSTGLLAFVELAAGTPGDLERSLVWVDRSGEGTPLAERQGAFGWIQLSPEGKRAAVQIVEGRGLTQIWIYEIATATWTRLTTGGGFKTSPVWTPDGSAVVYANLISGRYRVFSSAADFSSDEAIELFDHEHNAYPSSFGPGGDLVFTERIGLEDLNILRSPTSGREVVDVVRTSFREGDGVVSPNGRFLAYRSNRSGVDEVYVEAFPDGGPRTQVSSGGGSYPRWSPVGDELFYWNDNRFMAVQVRTEPDFALKAERRILFESDAFFTFSYDVARDGRQFLMVEASAEDLREDTTRQRVNIIVNWFTELERLVPTD